MRDTLPPPKKTLGNYTPQSELPTPRVLVCASLGAGVSLFFIGSLPFHCARHFLSLRVDVWSFLLIRLDLNLSPDPQFLFCTSSWGEKYVFSNNQNLLLFLFFRQTRGSVPLLISRVTACADDPKLPLSSSLNQL